MESTVESRKTSNYQQDKSNKWQGKSGTDSSKGKVDNTSTNQSNLVSKCGWCGKKSHPRDQCPAHDKDCTKSGRKGHFQAVFRSGDGGARGRSQSRGRGGAPQAGSTNEGSGSRAGRATIVRCSRVSATRRVIDDSEPTPLMRDVLIKPTGHRNNSTCLTKEGTAFNFDAFPDTGCQQSLVSADLVSAYGMVLDPRRTKQIQAVDGGDVPCSGSVTFKAPYGGQETDILALVTPALHEEVVLGWRALQRLGVIPKDFPRCSKDQVTTKKTLMPLPPQEHKKKVNRTDDTIDLTKSVKGLIKEYESVFKVDFKLQTMKGPPMKIELVDNVPIKPLHIYTPRKTPYAYQNAAKAKLNQLEEYCITEKVTGPTDWCSPMSFVPKPDRDVRPVIDLVHLNKYVKRPTHPFPSPKDIIAQVPATAKYFAVFDAKSGYWQIALDDDSKPLTMFITEWGCYWCRRLPMGLASSGDEFCARTDKALAEIQGVFKLVDDIIIIGSNKQELLDRIRAVFT